MMLKISASINQTVFFCTPRTGHYACSGYTCEVYEIFYTDLHAIQSSSCLFMERRTKTGLHKCLHPDMLLHELNW